MSIETAARIDAHVHWWNTRRTDYGWLTPEMGELYRDFGPAQTEPLLSAAGIDGVILVQAAPTEAETHDLFGQAVGRPYVRGVVGWVDLTDPARLEVMARDDRLVAVRPMLQDLPDPAWIMRSEVAPALHLLEDLDLPFEALVLPPQLPYITTLLERHPRLRMMLDHAAKPPIETRQIDAWQRDLARLSASPNVVCKFSGLVTEAETGVAIEALEPYVAAMFDLFGAGRMVWGSDWPVLTLRLDYDVWLSWAETLTACLSATSRAAVFGGNALRFYQKSREGVA